MPAQAAAQKGLSAVGAVRENSAGGIAGSMRITINVRERESRSFFVIFDIDICP